MPVERTEGRQFPYVSVLHYDGHRTSGRAFD
jgi:hypothetical protein